MTLSLECIATENKQLLALLPSHRKWQQITLLHCTSDNSQIGLSMSRFSRLTTEWHINAFIVSTDLSPDSCSIMTILKDRHPLASSPSSSKMAFLRSMNTDEATLQQTIQFGYQVLKYFIAKWFAKSQNLNTARSINLWWTQISVFCSVCGCSLAHFWNLTAMPWKGGNVTRLGVT